MSAFKEILAAILKPLVRLRSLCAIPCLSYLRKMLCSMVEVQYLSCLGKVVFRLLPYPTASVAKRYYISTTLHPSPKGKRIELVSNRLGISKGPYMLHITGHNITIAVC